MDYETQAEGQLVFIHNDHLGTPRLMTGEYMAVAWRAEMLPFGETVASIDGVKQALRFPGQYGDEETGYHYNYHRDYDPTLGRYLQSDPIGLNGGVNTFGYVSGNPLSRIDLLGLKDFTQEETGRFLSVVRQAGSLRQAFNNHRSGGSLDVMYGQYQDDTFNVNGNIYNAGEFGNFMAAYSGEYHWGAPGYYAVRGVGIYYDRALYPNPVDAAPWETNVWDWDADSVPALKAGRSKAQSDVIRGVRDYSCPMLPQGSN